jgi:hypothetical protein
MIMNEPKVIAVIRNAWDTADISTILLDGRYETIVFPDNHSYRTHFTQRYPMWSFTEEDAANDRVILSNSPLEDRVRD